MPSLTALQIDAELHLAERGQSDGRRDKPGPDAAQLSEAEAAVLTRIENELSQQSSSMLGVSGDFSALPQELETLASEPQTILTQFRGGKARAQSAAQIELANAHTDYERAYRGYRLFRRQHGLTEVEPSYDMIFWRKVFWLTLLFSVEVAANGWVIGQASPGGLVQGWTTALLISVLVVLTGTLIGVGPWRYLNYQGVEGRGRLHLLWAAPAVVAGLTALTFFAFYVAHYRYALTKSSLDAPVPDNVLTGLLHTPFAPFEQLDSLILFVIAMLIGVFAIARGARWDDPYPGYGPLHRRMLEERERAQALAQTMASQVDEAKDIAAEALNDIAARSQQAIGALHQALAKAQDNAFEWDRSCADLVDVGRDAIQIYRNANRAARKSPAPRYFLEDPFEKFTPASSAAVIRALESALQRATGNITQCKSQLAGARAQLEAEYKSFYADELTPFLRSVSDTAATRVRDEFADAPGAAAATPARSEDAGVVRLPRWGQN
jgi:hypothetical protein